MLGDRSGEMDKISPEKRSANMRAIRSHDSVAEITVRKTVHALGYRYRLHDASLPGKPDLVMRKRRKVIFVHGCFWHQHSGCREGRKPRSRLEYWEPKLRRNVERDESSRKNLEDMGWQVLTVWECEVGNREKLNNILRSFLNDAA